MKKLLISTCLVWLATITCVHAQAIKASMPIKQKNHPKDSAAVSGIPGKIVTTGNYLNEINTHATRDFIQRFNNPANVEWTKCGKGYIVTCTLAAIRSRVAYNAGGNWVYTIKYLTESQMPREVRALVKSSYYDYTITQVEEIVQQINTDPVYLVHMKDDHTWKNVLVGNGEMVVMEEYDKW